MTFEEIKTLLDAGFTKSEIMQLNGSAPGEQIQAEAPAEVPIKLPNSLQEQPKAVTSEPATAAPITDEQLTKLAQLINADKASIDIPPTRSLDDVLADHYKELMVGTN